MDSHPHFHTVSLPFLANSLDNEQYKHTENDHRQQTALEQWIDTRNIAKVRKKFEIFIFINDSLLLIFFCNNL